MQEYFIYYGLIPVLLRMVLPPKIYWLSNVVFGCLSLFILIKSIAFAGEVSFFIGTFIITLSAVAMILINSFFYVLVSFFIFPGLKLNEIQERVLKRRELE